ncbi:MAG: hypothetical protein PUC15_08375 [Lentisphaeria bacterium]|nr:hypothetical protein [Lentisphaeria bacterium]
MGINTRFSLAEVRTNAQIINWLSCAAKPEDGDLEDRLNTIADLAEAFAEDARKLADNLKGNAQ